MATTVGSDGIRGMNAYFEQTQQSAWREQMLSQMLGKVREMQPQVRGPQLAAAAIRPHKGSLLDVVV